MKRLVIALVVLLGSFVPAHAACSFASGAYSGSSVSASGGQAFVSIPAEVGCYVVVTQVQARLLNVSASGGTLNIAFYETTACSGTPTWTLTQLAVTSTAKSHDDYQPGELTLTNQQLGFPVCVGFTGTMAGAVEAITVTYRFANNVNGT